MAWPVAARRLGRIGWAQAEQVQAGLVALRKAGAEAFTVPVPPVLEVPGLTGLAHADLDRDTLLLCEHPPVYTAGRKVKFAPEEEQRLTALGAEIQQSKRGGEITFHGPGQLVAYPIVDLRARGKGARWFVNLLEESLIQTCGAYGIVASRCEHTGVWVGDEKIAAIGIQVSRGVTSHGVALNCDVDLGWFEHIVPCGIEDRTVTSIAKQKNYPRSRCLPALALSAFDIAPTFVEKFGELWAE